MSAREMSQAEHLKFRLLSQGLIVTSEAQDYIDAANGLRPMTPADYASTSGLILELEDDVWVNAPIELYNPNFVRTSPFRLTVDRGHLAVEGCGMPGHVEGISIDRELRVAFAIKMRDLARLHDDALILSPMPVIDEIDPETRLDPRLGIYRPSDLGVSIRMAILESVMPTSDPE